MPQDNTLPIIRAYDDWIVRAYSTVRFHILRQRFLDEIGQYLPASGKVLDIGCGFGLFSLYYARQYPQLDLSGLDLSPRRIAMAQAAADRLTVSNVRYAVRDAGDLKLDEQYQCIYLLDLIHHLPVPAVRPLLERLHAALAPGGRLLIKEVDTRPRYKMWFTWFLDQLMDRRATVRYWPQSELAALLSEVGFENYRHALVDYLPYPHVLFICRKRTGS